MMTYRALPITVLVFATLALGVPASPSAQTVTTKHKASTDAKVSSSTKASPTTKGSSSTRAKGATSARSSHATSTHGASSAGASAGGKAGVSKSAASKSGVNANKSGVKTSGKRGAKKSTGGRQRGQTAPTPERITEIQQALAKSGAFEGTPSGKWDDSTADALRKFQAAHGLNASGKLDAPTLNQLGLGSSTAGMAPPTPSVKTSSTKLPSDIQQ